MNHMFQLQDEDHVLAVADKIRAEREAKAQYEASTREVGGAMQMPSVPHMNDEITRHHAPGPLELQQISAIRHAARNFLDVIDSNCPPCADRTDAKRKVREAMMTANVSIVLNGLV